MPRNTDPWDRVDRNIRLIQANIVVIAFNVAVLIGPHLFKTTMAYEYLPTLTFGEFIAAIVACDIGVWLAAYAVTNRK